MTWTENADRLARAAEVARQNGDDVAMIALLKGSAECAQIARLHDRIDAIVDDMRALRGAKH